MKLVDRIGRWMERHPLQYCAALTVLMIAAAYAGIYFWSRA